MRQHHAKEGIRAGSGLQSRTSSCQRVLAWMLEVLKFACLGFFLAFDAEWSPRNSLQTPGTDSLVAVDALAKGAIADSG